MPASARIAQMVEHLICNQGVGGSIPSPGTNSLSSFEHLSLYAYKVGGRASAGSECRGVRGSTPSVGTISSPGSEVITPAFVSGVGEGRMPEGRTTQDAVVEGSTPSLGTKLSFKHLICNWQVSGSIPSVDTIIKRSVGGGLRGQVL